jgi:hypothetical protein
MPSFLTRNGCRIAYTKTPAPWGRIADVVYLPGWGRQPRLWRQVHNEVIATLFPTFPCSLTLPNPQV